MLKVKYVRFDRDPDVASYDIESDDNTARSICYIQYEILLVLEDLKSVFFSMSVGTIEKERQRKKYLDRNLVDLIAVNVKCF